MSEYFEVYAGDYRLNRNRTLLMTSSENPGITDFTIEKEVNKSGSATFTVLPTHPYWQQFLKMITVVDVYIRGKNVFHGRVVEINTDFYKQRTIKCEGSLAWLLDNYRPAPEDDPVVLPEGADESESSNDGDAHTMYAPEIATVRDCLANGFNSDNNLEAYKHFNVGIVEFVPPYQDFVPENAVKRTGKIDESDGETIVVDPDWVYIDQAIDIEDGSREFLTYVGSIEQPEDMEHTGYGIIYFYDSNMVYKGSLPIGNNVIINPDFHYPGSRYVKLSAMGSVNNIISLVHDRQIGEAFTGGSYADFFTKWVVDNAHMMLRARYTDTDGNLLDILNPDRYKMKQSVATIELSKNMINMEAEESNVEPYSIIAPTFEQKAYFSYPEFRPVDISNAILKYGRIVKSIDFGTRPELSNWQEMNAFRKMMERLVKLASNVNDEKYTISALDNGIIFDNASMSVIDIGEPVTAVSKYHNLSKKLMCISLKLDLFNPENNSYVVGTYIDDSEDWRIKTLTENYAEEKKRRQNSSS